MFVELHILQNFAPSNLNRDDTGSPKDCEFGGYRRARISSQCLKRAVRSYFSKEQLIDREYLAVRTKRLVDEAARRLAERNRPEDEARRAVGAALAGLGLRLDEVGRETQYLVFLGHKEIDELCNVCDTHWDELASLAKSLEKRRAERAKEVSARDAKKEEKNTVPDEVKKALLKALDGRRAADLALFGRMLADIPDRDVDAAAQVAHALSTNRVSVEFDFYTAVDDLRPTGTPGADMLGTIEFNSACFYRYANIDLGQLATNLDGDTQLVEQTLKGFLQAVVMAVPTGKQNSMAAHNPPSFAFVVLRKNRLWNLANAFAQPVRPDAQGDLVQRSIAALDAYWGRLTRMYGDGDIIAKWCITLEDGLENLKDCAVRSFDELVTGLMEQVQFESVSAVAR